MQKNASNIARVTSSYMIQPGFIVAAEPVGDFMEQNESHITRMEVIEIIAQTAIDFPTPQILIQALFMTEQVQQR